MDRTREGTTLGRKGAQGVTPRAPGAPFLFAVRESRTQAESDTPTGRKSRRLGFGDDKGQNPREERRAESEPLS